MSDQPAEARTEEYVRRDGTRYLARPGWGDRLKSRPTLVEWEDAGRAFIAAYDSRGVFVTAESLQNLARRVDAIEAEIAEYKEDKA